MSNKCQNCESPCNKSRCGYVHPALRMTVDEALGWADEWAKGRTFYPDSTGWAVVCVILAAEVRRLRNAGNVSDR